ncbi:Ig-like domain-containing protein [bacterium]|nr:Ig-like domain-containing protein [candidate division CSSED10-310 bacterium]
MKKLTTALLLGLACVTGILVWTGCDKPSPTDPASSARINMTAGSLSLPADGVSETTVSAYVRNPDGSNADGVPINWHTTCGLLAEGASTVAAGIATATLVTEAFPCTATVSVDLPTMTLHDSIDIEFYNEEAAVITITAAPENIPADGVSTSTITAVVKDDAGRPVPDDTTVYFSTDAGTLSTSSAGTAQGHAIVTLTASNTEETARIMATSDGHSASTSVRFYSTLPGSIDLRASMYEIPADGSSKSVITATVKDVNGRYVTDGTKVYFTTTDGSLNVNETTTEQGIATVFLTSASYEATAAVAATAGNVTSVIYIRFSYDASDLEIDPSYAQVIKGGKQVFTARGGSGSYTWYLQSGAYGSLSTSTGPTTLFTAGNSEGSVKLILYDSRGDQTEALIDIVPAPLAVEPDIAYVQAGSTYIFNAEGGIPSFTWSLSDSSYGSIAPIDVNGNSATFTSNGKTGVVTLNLLDSQFESAIATIFVAQ